MLSRRKKGEEGECWLGEKGVKKVYASQNGKEENYNPDESQYIS